MARPVTAATRPQALAAGMTHRRVLILACAATLLHLTGARMIVPVLPLYATAQGATTTSVGLIMGAHMVVAAVCALPLGRASDRWGRRRFVLGGMALSAVTALLLPLLSGGWSLMVVYGLAGAALAAFTPSLMSLIGDVSPPGALGRAYASYTTALYTAFGLGPILGGVAAEAGGHHASFIGAALIIGAGIPVAAALPRAPAAARPALSRGTLSLVVGSRHVWAGWLAMISGLAPWGAVLTFLPLLGRDRGLSPTVIGIVLGAQALVNTAARLPAGWFIDRTPFRLRYIVVGLAAAALGTAAVPHVVGATALTLLAAGLGAVVAVSFVAIGVALAEASTPATRGLVMGGYTTSIYVGYALGSMPLGPVIAHWGYAAAFGVAAAIGLIGTLTTAVLWAPHRAPSRVGVAAATPAAPPVSGARG